MKRKKLKAIIDEAEALISGDFTSSSPEFQAWKTKAERFLIDKYGEESYEVREFQKIRYSLSVYFSGTPQSEFVTACRKGVERAKAILVTYLEEIEETEQVEKNVDSYKKLKYEFQGIRSVILDYTDSGLVKNFLDGLEQGISIGDKEKIKYFLLEINNWYNDNWTEISNNEYVYNLEEHKRNKELLKEILGGIEDSDFSLDEKRVINKDPIIFLSHRSSDKKYGDALEKLFSSMGIKNEQLIYTSHPLHKIPFGKNIFEYLRDSFGKRIFVIILWSDDYLESPACLNEMGAAWVTQSDYSNIYVPTFDFKNPKYYQCAVDKNKMGAVLDGSETCKANIIELKNKLVELFGLKVDENQWIYSLDQFIKEIS